MREHPLPALFSTIVTLENVTLRRALLLFFFSVSLCTVGHAVAPTNTYTYVDIGAAPAETKVPITLGFRTSMLSGYSSSASSKVRVGVSSGFDFSSFQLSDVLDIAGLPDITWVETSALFIEFVMLQEPLKANTSYEISFLAKTASAGSIMSNISVRLYSRSDTMHPWIELEQSLHNQGRGRFPRQSSNLVGAQVSTAPGTISGSVLAAWAASSGIIAFLLDLRMSSFTSGVASIMPFPPSAWNFNARGAGLVDGAACPTGDVQGVEGQAVGVRFPSTASHCYVRQRGQHVDSIDLWFLGANISEGTSVKVFLPEPMAGVLGSWYISYRQFGSTPGHLLTALPINSGVQRFLQPKPYAIATSVTSAYPNEKAALQIQLRVGTNLIYKANSRVELRFSNTTFSVEDSGCQVNYGNTAPLGVLLLTDTSLNVCTMTWTPTRVMGTGTVEVASNGTVNGTGVDFFSMDVIGMIDPEHAAGTAWHYLLVNNYRYIVKTRRRTSATSEHVQILVASAGQLNGTNTKFVSGSFYERLHAGDQVIFNGRTFVVTLVHDDTTCDVTENGIAPTVAAPLSSYIVKWISRLEVLSFHESTAMPSAAEGSSFAIERLIEGSAYWNKSYTLTVYGRNAANSATSSHSVRVYSGRYSVAASQLEYWESSFAGAVHAVDYPQLVSQIAFYPTTVAAGAKARAVLAFTTGTSSRFSGGSDENRSAGMLLQIACNLTAALTVHKADGTDLANPTAEESRTLCSFFFLELWSDAAGGFPSPSYCWWDSWSAATPRIFMRFEAGNGLKTRSRYELAFLISLQQTANQVSTLLKLDVVDGNGRTVINHGYAGISKTVVPQSISTLTDEPIITSVEILNGEPLPSGSLQLRLRGGKLPENYLKPYQKIRLFFFPLTAWNIPTGTCIVTRSDGVAGDTSCDTVTTDRNTNTLELGLSPNAVPLSNFSDTVFTFTGVPAPTSGFFRGEIGAEAWNYPRGVVTKFMATYTSSAEGRLSSDNFFSSPVSGGSGHIDGYDNHLIQANNTVSIVYRPAATCRSGNTNPCKLSITAPAGFTVVSASTLNTTVSGNTVGMLQLAQPPVCNVLSRTCILVMNSFFTLWAHSEYGLQISVVNPYHPVAKDSQDNIWQVQLSGGNRWDFGPPEYAAVATLMQGNTASNFAILGRLGSAVVSLGSLTCGASTYFRFQFITNQHVPLGGNLTVRVPQGFTFEASVGSTSCDVQSVVNWPSQTTCTTAGGIITIALPTGLEASTFYALDIPGSLPASIINISDLYFSFETGSNSTRLDEVARVSWSPQTNGNGSLLFPELFDCYPQGVDYIHVSVNDMRPYAVTAAPAVVEIFFRWDALDILDCPLDVRVYAPPSYQWQEASKGLDFNAAPSILQGTVTPLMLDPRRSMNVTRDDANVLYLMSTDDLNRGILYGFTAQVRVPVATPGRIENVAGVNAWYLVFGAGVTKRWAGFKAISVYPEVRAIRSFKVQTSTDVPLQTNLIIATFTTATSLSQAGVLQISLPESFSFGVHLGQACATDNVMAVTHEPSASALPADMQLSCVKLATNSSAFRWIAGATGLSAGKYAAAMYVRNPPFVEDGGRSPGSFVVRTFLDLARTTVADMYASYAAPFPSQGMPKVEVVTPYIDGSAGIFDPRPSASTWVVIAFELRDAISPSSVFVLQGPSGFEFQSQCQVHIGNGVTYSPLGNVNTNQPVHAPQYILFPSNSNTTCAASPVDQNVARFQVFPINSGWSSLPAVANGLYLFRVQVTNPPSAPSVNEWSLEVDNQQSGSVPGYELSVFGAPSVTPSNTATGQDNIVTIKFQNLHSIAGRQGSDHGLLMIIMPKGFQIQMASGALACLDFGGLINVTLDGRYLVSNVDCEGVQGQLHNIFLRNKRSFALPASTHEFTCRVRNSAYALEKQSWRFVSYNVDTLLSVNVVENSTVPGFALNLNLRSFSVKPQPAGQQSSGKNVTLSFKVELSQEIAVGDVLLVQSPSEYMLEHSHSAGNCIGYNSPILPAPACSGNNASFSFVHFDSDLLPQVQPFGTQNSTVISFQLALINPPVKPKNNTVRFVHCRPTSTNATLTIGFNATASNSGLCPASWQAIASVQEPLWPIVPQPKNVTITLLPPQVYAAGRSSLFKMQFIAASPGASKLRIQGTGMNFTGCTAEHGIYADTCVGTYGETTITLASGQIIPNGNAVFEITVKRVTNPTKVGATVWTITTFDAQGGVVDEKVGHIGYVVTGYLPLQAVVSCQASMLLDPNIPSASKSSCTADNPWYEHLGNRVTLRFSALPINQGMLVGGTGGLGYYLLVYPPAGYRISKTGVPFQAGSNFPTASGYSIFASTAFMNTTSTLSYFSVDALGIKLMDGLPQQVPFTVTVIVDNPASDVARNLWKVSLWDIGAQSDLYTNDGDWTGFGLKGTFLNAGTLTKVQWLVTDFPSETNVVRLTMQLASPLRGQSLTIKVRAPVGFVFDAKCLPTNPDVRPALTAQINTPWVSQCAVDQIRNYEASLTVAYQLEKSTEYATNLLLTNPPSYNSTDTWELYTFANNDLLNFVHYARWPAFAIQIMQASIYPEIKKYVESGLLHVSFRPSRDLAPFGEVLITAPEGFTLFCRLRPFFNRGNLPSGVTCSGVNTFAIIKLSGSDSLESGNTYHFAVRVTNPTAALLAQYHTSSPSVSSLSMRWQIRLQTQKRDLVHEDTRIVGYLPTTKAISRFSVIPTTVQAGAQVQLRVEFKLETILARWRTNYLELTAAGGFTFACADQLAQATYVLPATAIFPANVARFQNFYGYLEVPPTAGNQNYRNDGTTEDGRAIVDCSKVGVLGLAVDYTDDQMYGRYAFQVVVKNALNNPAPNAWTLRSYADGQLVEEGATGGYDVSNHTHSAMTSFQTASMARETSKIHVVLIVIFWRLWVLLL